MVLGKYVWKSTFSITTLVTTMSVKNFGHSLLSFYYRYIDSRKRLDIGDTEFNGVELVNNEKW